VREDALEVLARNRTDLLKSISQNLDIEEEAGHYLLSVESVIRSGIDYQATIDDLLCLKASTDILKRTLSPDELVDFLERTESGVERTVPRKKPASKPDVNLSRVLSGMMSDHVWKDRIKSPDNIGMAHGSWPSIETGDEYHYREHHPFHEQVHPLRIQNGITGAPTYESMLFEKYFGHDDTPWWEDDFHESMAEAPEEETFAKQAMKAEDAHEKHHRKLNSPIYKGITKYNNDTGQEETIYPFFGGPASKDVDNPYNHMETMRLYDYERWKEEEGTDMAALEEKFSGLSEEKKERAMQIQHFKDRMKALRGKDTSTSVINPIEGFTDEQIQEFIDEYGPEAAEPYMTRHSHSMGWDTLMKGMYFLKPEDRTRILQHISDHDTDDGNKQFVTLSDGKEFPISRLKKNLEMNAGAEMNYITRGHKSLSPNVPATIEDAETDSKYIGDEGGIATALNAVDIPITDSDGKVTGVKSAYDTLLERISKAVNEGRETGTEIPISKLFPHNEFNQNRINAFAETEESLAEAVSKHANESNEADLDREGLLSLIGYNDDLSEIGIEDHPTLGNAYQGPLLEREQVERVLDEYQKGVSLGKQSKDIKNAYKFLRSGFNPPTSSDMPDGHEDHHIDMDGKKRGLAHMMTKFLTDRGGLGRDPTTYLEFLHHHHMYGDEESLLGQMSESMLEPRIGTTGLYGGLHATKLQPGFSTPMTALQILSRHGVSRRDIDGSGVAGSSHNNYTDELSTLFPELMAKLHAELPTDETHFRDRKFDRETSADFQQFHPYAAVGSVVRRDTSLANRAAHSNRMMFALGRMNSPLNPPTQMTYSYLDLLDNPSATSSLQGLRPLYESSGVDFTDLLLHLGDAKKEIPDVEPGGTDIKRRLSNQINDLQEQLDRVKQMSYGRQEADVALLEADIDEAKTLLEQYEMRQLKDSRNLSLSQDFSEKLDADAMASATYAREVLLPLILEKDPDAFNTGNPVQALANAMRLAHDASRGLAVDPNHTLETIGYHEKEETRESLEQKVGSRGQTSPHRKLATALRDKGVELLPPDAETPSDEEIDRARNALGLPDDELHNAQVEDLLSSLVGPTKASTFGQIATMGEEIHPSIGNMFSEFKDIGDFREHIDGFEDIPTRSKREAKAFNTGNTAYRSLGFLRQLARMGDMTAYGLGHQEHPTPDKDINSTSRERERHKALSSHIFTFDEGQSGPLEEASAGSITKPVHGKMKVPIRPNQEMSGNVAVPVHNSGEMDHGRLMSPSIGTEYGSRGSPMVGQNLPDQQLLNTVSIPWLNEVFKESWTNDLYSNPDLALIPDLQSNQTRVGLDGTLSMDMGLDYVGKMLKGELPKELPLIDPLHRIFELEDMEQLRGFTGEWVVSKYHEGTRVKVKRKGSRVDITDEDGEKVGVDDSMRSALRKVCERDYVIDGTIVDDELHINDIMLYEETDVTDLTTRERVKLIRGQFDSHEPVHVPSPESIRVTDEVGFEEAVKDLGGKGQKLLLRDAKSTYMKGEERHPKWVLLAKSEERVHIPFAMEMDRGHFVLHLPEDLVKYEIVDNEPVNPIAAIGSITKSDYSLRLADSLEPYWRQGFNDMLKEELETKTVDEADWDEDKADEGMTDERAKRIQQQSAGLLKPKKDKNLLLKPKETLKALLTMERILDKLEKATGSGHYPMSGGRALGIDVGSDIASPRGPTSLTSEHAVPDWDMKERPEEDPEKPSDYPKKPRRKEKNEEQHDDLEP